jgi:hypothetical protein
MDPAVEGGLAQLLTAVLAVVFGAVAVFVYVDGGLSIGVVVLGALFLLCLWAAAAPSSRLRKALASFFSGL